MNLYRILILLSLPIFVASCGVNLFSPFSVKDYPEANEYEAKNLIDQGRYAEILSNAEKYPAQDHTAAAIGIMGFDIKMLTNFLGNQSNRNNILLSWLDPNDTNYVLDLTYAMSRLRQENTADANKTITLMIGGMASTMLGFIYLAEIANTNAINASDGLSEDEIDILEYWLGNPPQNITNLGRSLGKDKTGTEYTIGSLIGRGATTLLSSTVALSMLSPELQTNQEVIQAISNVFSTLDGDGDGNVTFDEVTNFIISFLSNI